MISNNDEDWIIRSEARKGTFRDYNGDWETRRYSPAIQKWNGYEPDIGSQFWGQARTAEIADRVLHVD